MRERKIKRKAFVIVEKMEEKQKEEKGIIGAIDNIISGEAQSKTEKKIEDFIPKLKKGGKEKSKEIIPDSPLDSKKEEKKTGKSFLIFLGSQDYQKSLSWVLKGIEKKYEKIIYVTLTAPKNSVLTKLKDAGIETKKFFFVDGVSLTTERKEKTEEENCIYISSPEALVELSLTISDLAASFEKIENKTIVFDSVSTIIENTSETSATKFVNSVANKTKMKGIDTYFFALKEDFEKKAMKEIGLLMDETTTYEDKNEGNQLSKQVFVPSLGEMMNEVQTMQREISTNFYERGLKNKMEEIKERLEILEEINDKIRKLEFANEKEKEKYENIYETIKEIKAKLTKAEKINTLEEKIIELYRKIEEHDEKTQLGEELRKSIETQKNNELKGAIEEIKRRLKALEGFESLEEEVKALKSRLEKAQEEIEKGLNEKNLFDSEKIKDLENEIKEIAKKIDEERKSQNQDFQTEDFSKQLEEIKAKIEKQSENYEELIKDAETQTKAIGFFVSDAKEKLASFEKVAEIEKNLKSLETKVEQEMAKIEQYRENIGDVQEKLNGFEKLYQEIDKVREKIDVTQQEVSKFLKFPEQLSEMEVQTESKIKEMIESMKYKESIEEFEKQISKLIQKEQTEKEKIETNLNNINKNIENKLNELIEKEKQKEQTEKEKIETSIKIMNKISELEKSLSKLEKRLEISELERMLLESDSELKELEREKTMAQESLKRLSDPGYSSEKEAELKATLEKIQDAESVIMKKMKETNSRMEKLKEN